MKPHPRQSRSGNFTAPAPGFSRRRFLRNAGFAAAALATRPAWPRIIGANVRINVGVVGLGARGSDHLSLLLEHRASKPDIEVVALCDVYQKRFNMASKYVPDAKTYTYHQELIQRSDVDVIFTATLDHWHAPISIAAIEAGKDVYVEKSFTRLPQLLQ